MTIPRLFPSFNLTALLCALTLACVFPAAAADRTIDEPLPAEQLPPGTHVTGLAVEPASVALRDRTEYAQLLVTATLNTGDKIDVTRLAEVTLADDTIARLNHHVMLRPQADGKTAVKISLGGHEREIPVSVANVKTPLEPDYIRDIMPVLSRLGCNQGTCHGAKDGKNGFKLSLRGYDGRAFVDRRPRRTPGQLCRARPVVDVAQGHRRGAARRPAGHHRHLDPPRSDPRLDRPRRAARHGHPAGHLDHVSMQQFRVTATYADGFTRDVTAESFIETGDMEIATTDQHGLLTTLRRGEAPVLARFEGRYAATTLTVMGDRSG